jgi:gamma-glutamyltranspeptidase
MGRRYAAATSQPLATLAGREMFLMEGNAVNAALAMAIALTVVEPTSNGIGSDAFAFEFGVKNCLKVRYMPYQLGPQGGINILIEQVANGAHLA